MNNVIELFDEFNQGTHGAAGTLSLVQLQALRTRVEDELCFSRGCFTDNIRLVPGAAHVRAVRTPKCSALRRCHSPIATISAEARKVLRAIGIEW